ncbi:hypothetical protein ACY0I1_11790 [Clostridium perfringens]|uniref:hypothetical protein n=1 Tax=Clostridium perfringens TaxID=1502 RepID=UPI000BB547F6|nr:hypothetical protein [Clostridium perfringens]ATD48257.1 hypothetical protein CMR01_05625 [Clostridium perfringens]MBO3409710.1 hypothetical protein [Clostridium perfringens]MBO3432398.1 hypothetical protein [Clostridium perfringens]MDK0789151.1 hypothetical protein [Clostridium perfringens]HAT4334191.1 hypothetical protein [Clostridium perfringens]
MKINLKMIKEFISAKKNWTICGLIVSAISLIVSFNTYKLSLDQYNNSKIDIYRAEINNDGESMKLVAYSDDIYLQLAEVYFPPNLTKDKKAFEVINSDYTLNLPLLILKLEETIKENTTVEKGKVGIMELSVPMIISSNYIHNGVIQHGLALYYMYIITKVDEFGNCKIYLKSILYDRRLEKNIDIYKLLNNEWDNTLNCKRNSK